MPRSDAEPGPPKPRRSLTSYCFLIALAIPVVLVAVAAAILIWPVDKNEGQYPAKTYMKYATPSSLSPLLNDDAAAGDSVFLNEVRLIPAAKGDEFLVRGAHGKYLLVVANGNPVSLDGTATANVQGVVRTLPPKTTLKHAWKLTAKDLERIAGEQYYLDAQRIQIEQPANSND